MSDSSLFYIFGRRPGRLAKRRRYEDSDDDDDDDDEDNDDIELNSIDNDDRTSDVLQASKIGDAISQDDSTESDERQSPDESREKLGRGARTRAKVVGLIYDTIMPDPLRLQAKAQRKAKKIKTNETHAKN